MTSQSRPPRLDVGLGLDVEVELRRLFRHIFEHELDYVWTSLRRLGVHARDLEDVTQEVFVRVLHKLAEYDRTRPVRPWLFAFAFRCAADWRRLVRHRVEVPEAAWRPHAVAPDAEERLARSRDIALVQRALQEIDIDRRAVFILYELDEYPMPEIAEQLSIPLFTAYSRLRVARQEFTNAARRLLAKRGVA